MPREKTYLLKVFSVYEETYRVGGATSEDALRKYLADRDRLAEFMNGSYRGHLHEVGFGGVVGVVEKKPTGFIEKPLREIAEITSSQCDNAFVQIDRALDGLPKEHRDELRKKIHGIIAEFEQRYCLKSQWRG